MYTLAIFSNTKLRTAGYSEADRHTCSVTRCRWLFCTTQFQEGPHTSYSKFEGKKKKKDNNSFMITSLKHNNIVMKIYPFWSVDQRKDMWVGWLYEVFSLYCFFSHHILNLIHATAITSQFTRRAYQLYHSLSIKPNNIQE